MNEYIMELPIESLALSIEDCPRDLVATTLSLQQIYQRQAPNGEFKTDTEQAQPGIVDTLTPYGYLKTALDHDVVMSSKRRYSRFLGAA